MSLRALLSCAVLVVLLAPPALAREASDAAEQRRLCRNPKGYVAAEQQQAACDMLLRQPGLSPRLQAQYLIGRGLALRDMKRRSSARDDFDKAVALRPKNAEAWYGLALVQADSNAFGEAKASLDRALALDRRNFRSLILRGWVNQRLGDEAAARADYETARRLKPKEAQPLTGLGELHLLAGEREKAIELFGAALKLNRYSTTARLLRANAYIDLTKPELALPDAEQLVALYPGEAMGYALRAELHHMRGNVEWALQDYDRALLIDPARPTALANRALIKEAAGDPYGALRDIDRALALEKSDPAFHLARGRMMFRALRMGEALAAFDRVLQLSPKHGEALRYRAHTRLRIGDNAGALVDAERAIDLAATPEDKGRALLMRALVNEYIGVLDAAAADLDVALGMGGQQPDVHLWRARLLHQLGDVAGMMADLDAFERIEQDKPRLAEGKVLRGQADMQYGRYEGAVQNFDAAIALDPANATAYVERGYARYVLSHYEGALADYDQALVLVPGSLSALGNRCVVLVAVDRLADALRDCDGALLLSRDQAALFSNRGIVLLRLGRAAEALQDFEAGLARDPNNAQALYGRGIARLRLGQANGRADVEAAARNNGEVRAEFAKLGLQP